MGYESKVMVVYNYGNSNNEFRHIVAEVNLGKTAEEIVNAFDIPTNRTFYIGDSGWTIDDFSERNIWDECEVREDRYGDCFMKCSNPQIIVDVINKRFEGKDYSWYADEPNVKMLCAMILAYSEGLMGGTYELIHYGY